MDSSIVSLFRTAGLSLGLGLAGCQPQVEGLGKASASSTVEAPPAPAPKSAPQVEEAKIPDLKDPATWDRHSQEGELVRGQAKVVVSCNIPQNDKKCLKSDTCLCLPLCALFVQGPRPRDHRQLFYSWDGEGGYPCTGCTGSCPLPLGDAILEGRLREHGLSLTKEPRFLDGRKAEPTNDYIPGKGWKYTVE